RLARAPLAHILGARGFWSLDLAVTPDVLVPRPETEHVVEALLAADAPAHARVLDLGVGSGAILLSVLAERPDAFGLGVDASPAAIAVARRNARAHALAGRCAFLVSDWDAALDARFDLIACNPPYVRSGDIAALEPEVRDHEPRGALDGGADGLDAYRRLAPRLTVLLAPGGTAAFEVGAGQAGPVKELFTLAGLSVELGRDLAGRDRVVRARRQGEFSL
ncbi:MAG: peptide chain release factor N(5)-glutamine methyltransferase, partial [Caulobacterales bacterium]|nr:peptide chain release factor N(5)-glutamine methyltransferase [Caulobacterales bacterium]